MANLSGVPTVDFSIIGDLPQTYREGQVAGARSSLADLAQSDGTIDYGKAARRLISAGDLQGGLSLAGLAQKQQEQQLGLEGVRQVNSMLSGGEPQATVQPRGIRNNNPLNIEAGNFTQGQPGFAGSDGRFAKFATPDQGIDAAGKLLDTYRDKYGLNTVAGIIGRWAPTSDNNPTSSYVSAVAKNLGVDPNQPLDTRDPSVKRSLVMAMGQFENGRPIQVAQAQNGMPGAGAVGLDTAAQGRINRFTGVLANPYLPKSTADAVKTRLEGELKAAEPTGERKNYELYAAQERAGGREPMSFNDFSQQGKETEQEKGLSKYWVETYKGNLDAGRKAEGTKGVLNLMDRAINSPNFYSGPAADQVLAVKRAIAALGGNPNSAQPMEEFASLSNKNVFETLGGLGNQISDGDRRFITSAFPNLGNTPQGNRMMIEIQRRLADRQAEIASLSRDYIKSHGGKLDAGFDQAIADYAQKKPMFSPDEIAKVEAAANAAQPAATKQPSQPAIQHLRANPQLRAAFDEKYGQGASARVLGQ